MIKGKFLLVVILVLTFQVFAQKKEKTFHEWSKDEATKVLTDSPWAKTYQSSQGLIAAERSQVSREQADQVINGRASQAAPSGRFIPAPVVIRLNSALRIRQALVRLQQIAAGYDKMSEKDRAKFDESAKDFLACSACEKLYVVTITRFRNSGQGIDNEGIFQTIRFEDVKGKVYLSNENGEKRELVQFIAPKQSGESAVFLFRRFDSDGKPLIIPEGKELNFVFTADFLSSQNPYSPYVPRKFDFKVSKLIIDGKVEF
jgi:hypothetical protein